MPQGLNVDVKEVSASGIELIEEIMGYDTAIVIDAVATNGAIGAIYRLKPEQLRNTVHLTAPHLLNFASALEFGKNFAAASMPKRLKIYGVGIRPKTDFSEHLSPEVGKAAELIAEEIIEELVKANAG
jgi:hydrogenase maturation protease